MKIYSENSWDFFPLDLPQEYKDRAILLYEYLHVHDIAWSADSVLDILDILRSYSIVVLGGDVLIKKDNSYSFTGDNWYIEDSDLAESVEISKTYITNYLRKGNKDFIFSIVTQIRKRISD